MTAAPGALFEVPGFEEQIFDMDSVFITAPEIAEATSALAALASNFSGDEKVTNDLRARALAISLRLDGVHIESVTALENLIAGEPTQAVPGFDAPKDVSGVLWALGETLDVTDATSHDKLLACYLMDIAARIDPDHPGGIERFQKLALEGDFKGWARVVLGTGGGAAMSRPSGDDKDEDPPDVVEKPFDPGAEVEAGNPMPAGPAVKLAKTQAVTQVLTLGGSPSTAAGRIAGLEAGTIIGTLETPMTLRFANEDGSAIAGLEATSKAIPVAMRAIGAGWPANGGSITITVEGKYAAAAGQSIALPTAMLLQSMIKGTELIPGIVGAGSVGEGGEVTAAPDLLAYLRGLTAAAAPMLMVPEANLPQLYDLAIMGRLEPFLTHQIFTVSDLAGAGAIGVEQGDDTKRARLLFGEVQDLASSMQPTALISNSRVLERLERVLKLQPAHASARVLLASAGASELPDRLTLEGSIYVLEDAAAPVLKVMNGGGEPVVGNLAVFRPSKSALGKLRAKFDPSCVALADDLGALIEKIEAYSRLKNRASGRGPAMKQELTEAWVGVRTGYGALRKGGG